MNEQNFNLAEQIDRYVTQPNQNLIQSQQSLIQSQKEIINSQTSQINELKEELKLKDNLILELLRGEGNLKTPFTTGPKTNFRDDFDYFNFFKKSYSSEEANVSEAKDSSNRINLGEKKDTNDAQRTIEYK